MRFMNVVMILLLLSGCQIVGKSDEELIAEVDDLKVELREKDAEIFELNQSLDDSRYTTWKFCSASQEEFWYDFFCAKIEDYPPEWSEVGPISWSALANIIAIPVLLLALGAGAFLVIGAVVVWELLAVRRLHDIAQQEKEAIASLDAVLAGVQAEIDEANNLIQSIEHLSDKEDLLISSVDELSDRKNSLIDDLEELDEKIKNRKSSLGEDKEEGKSEGDDDDESDLF